MLTHMTHLEVVQGEIDVVQLGAETVQAGLELLDPEHGHLQLLFKLLHISELRVLSICVDHKLQRLHFLLPLK